MPTGYRRSHKGCWTCKRRRRKCDENKPNCLACQKAGHVCEGYESRLKWDNGVASRGHLTGSALPKKQDAPTRPKGRQRDLRKNSIIQEQSDSVDDTLDPELLQIDSTSLQHHEFTISTLHDQDSPNGESIERMQKAFSDSADTTAGDHQGELIDQRRLLKQKLFQEFLSSGSLLLHSTFVEDSPLRPHLSTLCGQSEVLYAVCIALQAYLSHGQNDTFYEFYSEALSLYRAHLHHPLRVTDEALLNAALLLCTIGIMNGTPWTVHIHGMQKLLDDRVAMTPLDTIEPNFINAIEVMGVFDLSRYFVGRHTPTLNIWRKYRAGQLVQHHADVDSSQPVAGIPRSLLDLMALDDHLREEDIWMWPGCDGTLIQCQLWDAFRYTLILSVRSNYLGTVNPLLDTLQQHSSFRLPSTQVLLTKALSALDAIFMARKRPEYSNSLVMNAISFPLFHAALIVFCEEDREGRHDLVTSWYQINLEKDRALTTRNAWELIQAVAEKRRQGIEYTAEMYAREHGMEIGLL